jgi:hypothetical protein
MRGDAPWAWSGVADQVWIINLHSKVAAQIYQSVSVNHGMGHVQPACKDCMGRIEAPSTTVPPPTWQLRSTLLNLVITAEGPAFVERPK